MKRKTNWPAIYILFALLAVLLFLVGQWGAGITTGVLTVVLLQLVRIGNHMETLAAGLHDERDALAGGVR